jgi:hypothetical protein
MQGEGDGSGDGLANTGPPGSAGTMKGTGFGLGFGRLSPGSLATLSVSLRK